MMVSNPKIEVGFGALASSGFCNRTPLSRHETLPQFPVYFAIWKDVVDRLKATGSGVPLQKPMLASAPQRPELEDLPYPFFDNLYGREGVGSIFHVKVWGSCSGGGYEGVGCWILECYSFLSSSVYFFSIWTRTFDCQTLGC